MSQKYHAAFDEQEPPSYTSLKARLRLMVSPNPSTYKQSPELWTRRLKNSWIVCGKCASANDSSTRRWWPRSCFSQNQTSQCEYAGWRWTQIQNSTLIPSHTMRILMPPCLVVSILQANFDEGSRDTTTIITPHGLFGYELLQFGVSSASAVSQCIVGTSIFMHTLMIFW